MYTTDRRLALLACLAAAIAADCVGHIRDQPSSDETQDANGGMNDAVVVEGPGNDAVAPGQDAVATLMCGTGQLECGSPATCVTVQSDPANCGQCSNACPAGQVCSAGACSATCSLTTCGSACTNLQTDPSHCGSCNNACAQGQSCVQGQCQLVCASGEIPCGSSCTSTSSDSANCGACGNACSSGETCSGGTCSCASGTTLCGSACVNTTSDPANCGSCSHACGAGMTCSNSTCTGGTTTTCPGAISGASTNASAAFTLENQVRTAMGLGCATMQAKLNTSSQNHCNYYTTNYASSTCEAGGPHEEVMGCSGFTGVNPWDRMTAAGYQWMVADEDMDFVDNGAEAVQQWIDSVWHRTPILSPWIRDLGYGSSGSGQSACDTMDFSAGATTPSTVVATYPYANQTGVPTSFNGTTEGPEPPTPPTGWPSGYPIHIYIQGGNVTSHTLMVDGSTTQIQHVWINPGSANDPDMLLSDECIMYAYSPLQSATRYRVQATGTNSTGTVNFNWTFTTQ